MAPDRTQLWQDPDIWRRPFGARIFLAAITGAALALSFPKPDLHWVAWVALAPLQVALIGALPGRALVLGLVAGAVYFAGTLYWITGVMTTYGALSFPVGVLLNTALVAYLALYVGMFTVALSLLLRAAGPTAMLGAPALWVTTELARGTLFTGFPWTLLGYSQVSVLPIAQAASIGGVYLVSFLVAMASAALSYAVIQRAPRRGLVAVLTVGLIAGTVVWGQYRLAGGALLGGSSRVRVGIVQGNVPQDEKWRPENATLILERYLRLSRTVVNQEARLIIWPESSTPFMFEEDPIGASALRRFTAETGATILFGSDQMVRGDPTRYYNSAFIVDPSGQTAAVYQKMRLVPFGEYVPLRGILRFAEPLVEAVSDFSAGTVPVMLPFEGHPISTAVCYEIVYPDLIRSFVVSGSELLTTITNDAWFGRSAAPYQHFQMASMRAVEQGRYLIRAANTGISGIVDPYGRIEQQSALFEPVALVGSVEFLNHMTVYGRSGDLFAYACLISSVVALVAARRTRGGGRGSRT